jgi:hypothetical protein
MMFVPQTQLRLTLCVLLCCFQYIAGGSDKKYAHVKDSKAWANTVRITPQAARSLTTRKGNNFELVLSKLAQPSLKVQNVII